MALRVTSVLALLFPLLFSRALSAGLPDGRFCQMNPSGTPVKPYCSQRQKCLVNKVPGPDSTYNYKGLLNGTCNSKLYTSKSPEYCMYRSIYFAIGTKNMLDKSVCEKCTCTLHNEYPKGQRGQCDCQTGSTCYVDRNGKSVKPLCPSQRATFCVLNKVNVLLNGKTVDRGNCNGLFTQGQCTVAGAKFSAKFYLNGTVGIPQINNRCQSCTCLNGKIVKCKKIAGCTSP